MTKLWREETVLKLQNRQDTKNEFKWKLACIFSSEKRATETLCEMVYIGIPPKVLQFAKWSCAFATYQVQQNVNQVLSN